MSDPSNEYSELLEAARTAEQARRAAEESKRMEAQRARQTELDKLQSLLAAEAKPEFSLACSAIARAGIPAAVELAEVCQDHLQRSVIRLRLTVAPDGADHLLELRGTTSSSVSAHRIAPGSETRLADWHQGDDLRAFARRHLRDFVANLPVP